MSFLFDTKFGSVVGSDVGVSDGANDGDEVGQSDGDIVDGNAVVLAVGAIDRFCVGNVVRIHLMEMLTFDSDSEYVHASVITVRLTAAYNPSKCDALEPKSSPIAIVERKLGIAVGVELGFFVAVALGDCDGFWIGLNEGESVGNAVGLD